MTPERWQQISRVYQSALEQAPTARDAFVANACRDDSDLRREVESLLAREQAHVMVDEPIDVAAAAVVGNAAGLPPGSLISPYRVTALIGEGGMGQVYRAHDTKLQRDVALKILPESFVHDPDRLARFTREAQVLASLNHPNIGAIYGFEEGPPEGGPDSEGVGAAFRRPVSALVLELVEGPTLADRIARGPIPVDEAIAIARQIAEALEAAHEHGIVHRDLKPANIKVRDDGTVKVLDFGLAKLTDADTRYASNDPNVWNDPNDPNARTIRTSPLTNSPTIMSPAMTAMGVILGTAAYMSPEQAKGKPADKRSDIWAFGCVLYEMLTGRRAFDGDDVSDTLAAVLRGEPDWSALGANVPARVRQVLRVCLQKDLRSRAGDVHDLRLAIDGAFETTVPSSATGEGAGRHRWRRALPVVTAAVAAGLLVALGAWALRPAFETPRVTRFVDRLPGLFFRGNGRQTIALSPDGRQILYNTTAGLYLRSLDTLEGRVVPGTEATASSPFFAHPFFSPDGRWIGYWDRGQLVRRSIRGGAPIVICAAAAPFGISWETDNTILFGQANGIMRVSANGGMPRVVIAARAGEQIDGPQLLPGGDAVLFTTTTASGAARWDAAQTVVQSMSTGTRKVVLGHGSDARYLPSGHLMYVTGDALFAVPFDVSRLEVVGGPLPIAEGLAQSGNPGINTGAANYAVSDDGTLVYLRGRFTSGGAPVPVGTLVWVDRSGREQVLGAPPRRYVYPRLSPDGTRVALAVADGEADIWIWDVHRRTMGRFTFGPQQDTIPVWTPDSRRLVWASGAPLNLYRQAADGTGTSERLTQSADIQRPSSFTPDGRRLLFNEGPANSGLAVGSAGPQDLAMLPLDGDRRATALVQTNASELNGEVSPDGRWMAYESDESREFQIYVRPFPSVDRGRWQVSINGGREPVWARNGKELFYLASDGAVMGVRVDVPVSSTTFSASSPAMVIPAGGYFTGVANQLGRTYDVSPDGLRFLRIKPAATGSDPADAPPELVVVLNWLQELKQRADTR